MSGVFKALGDVYNGNVQHEAYYRSAEIADMNANIATSQAAEAVVRQQRQASLVKGAAVAAKGASGFKASDNEDVLWSSALQSSLAAKDIAYEGQLKAIGYKNEASIDRFKGDQAKIGGYFNAAGDLMGSYTGGK